MSAVFPVSTRWSGRGLGPYCLLGGTSPFIKPAFPKTAALAIRNRIVLWFPQDLDLFQRSLAYSNTVLTRDFTFEDPYASYALFRLSLS